MQKYYWGMSTFQISILGLMLIGICGFLGIATLFILSPQAITNLTQSNIVSTSKIVGKWEADLPPPPKETDTPSYDLYTPTSLLDPTKRAELEARPTRNPCKNYPYKTIEFFSDKTYTVPFIAGAWSKGNYEILEDGRIKLDTSENIVLIYQISIERNTITFQSEKGCTFKYNRVSQ